MATLTNTSLDLIDTYKAANKAGNIVPVIEVLHTLNPLNQDAVYTECNQGSSHIRAIRTGLPDSAWGRLYQGVTQSKSTRQQITDATGFVEAMSGVDVRLLKMSKNAAALRLQEAEAHLESMAQKIQSAFFYEDTATNPLAFKGLAARYNKLASAGSAPATNLVIDGGGLGTDNTSMWFVTWGANQTTLLYPEGTQAGVMREDKGEVNRTDPDNGGIYFEKMEQFTQHIGLSVGDWRFNSRVANIDVSDLRAGTVDLYKLARQAYYKMQRRRNPNIKNGGMVSPGNTVIYCNREVLEAWEAQSVNSVSSDEFVRLKPREQEGQEIMTYKGIPIREVDALINNEARVVA